MNIHTHLLSLQPLLQSSRVRSDVPAESRRSVCLLIPTFNVASTCQTHRLLHGKKVGGADKEDSNAKL